MLKAPATHVQKYFPNPLVSTSASSRSNFFVVNLTFKDISQFRICSFVFWLKQLHHVAHRRIHECCIPPQEEWLPNSHILQLLLQHKNVSWSNFLLHSSSNKASTSPNLPSLEGVVRQLLGLCRNYCPYAVKWSKHPLPQETLLFVAFTRKNDLKLFFALSSSKKCDSYEKILQNDPYKKMQLRLWFV